MNDDEDFSVVIKPVGDAEREAYKNADYQTRMRIERANTKNQMQIINPGAVNKSHRTSSRVFKEKPGQRLSFVNDVIDEVSGVKDHFDLINADNDYMDEEVGRYRSGAFSGFDHESIY